MKRETPQESVPFPLARVLLPVGYGAPLHRTCIDQALVCLPTALLLDTRWSARSRRPGWSGAALRRRYGPRYLPLGHLLGNMAYREPGQIRIAALPQGVAALLEQLQQGHTPLLLLCGCAEYLRCHRRQICEAVQAADPSVTVWQPEQVLPRLAGLHFNPYFQSLSGLTRRSDLPAPGTSDREYDPFNP